MRYTNPRTHSAAGLLAAWRAGDNRLIAAHPVAAAAPQHGAQQQMRAVPRCQLT